MWNEGTAGRGPAKPFDKSPFITYRSVGSKPNLTGEAAQILRTARFPGTALMAARPGAEMKHATVREYWKSNEASSAGALTRFKNYVR
jgi:hypothetical protein